MFSKGEIVELWSATLKKFKEDFPHYDGLLRKHGWSAGVREKRNTAFGWADRREKKIIINWHLHKNSPKENIVDTMLHEIAHAIDFCKRGRSNHDAKWKAIAEEIGAIPKARSKKALKVEYKFVMVLRTGERDEKIRLIRGYNRRPARQKENAVMIGTYLTKHKDATLDKLWLYSWDKWVNICIEHGLSPYREDHK